MAELVITEADVTVDAGSQTYRSYETSEAITAGQLVYVNSDSKLALVDTTASASSTVLGVALTSSSADGDFIVVAEQGEYVVGATVVAGTYYTASSVTPGSICELSDLVSNDYVSYCIVGTSTTTANIRIYNSGIQKA